MNVDYEDLKNLVPLAVPLIKSTVDDWITPTLKQLLSTTRAHRNANPENIAKCFEEYLLRTYAKLSFMNTIVFGNQQRRIQDLYIPLTVVSSCPERTSFLINKWEEGFVPSFKRVVITDTAGMGKSTILKWLFLSSIDSNQRVPIFIELRSLSAEKTILDKIYDDLCSIDNKFEKSVLLNLLKSGKFLFFLDGFDEVAFEDRSKVTEDIQNFVNKAFNNLFVLASRHESALGSFGEFKEFTIKPLSKQEAYSLLRKYDSTLEYAEPLITELEASKFDQLKELMTNPMLVSLLFKAYSYKPSIPFKKQIFYRQVYDALFDMHDSTKLGAFVRKKHCNLDIDEFHTIMRDIGFSTAKIGKIEYEKDEILQIIQNARERNNSILFQPTSLLIDLVSTVPLYNKEGEHYKWAHKSVQDYFASQFIALDAKENAELLLKRIYENGHCRRFENILDMFHDSDNKSFRRTLLARLLKDYILHYESTYQHDYEGVSAEDVEIRKQLTFGLDAAIMTSSGNSIERYIPYQENKKSVFAKIFPDKKNLDSIIVFHFSKRPLILGMLAKPSFGLLSLLARKSYSYISKNTNTSLNISKISQNKPTLITDDPNSTINSAKNFKLINSLLYHLGYEINIDQVRRTLKSIEEERKDSAELSNLLNNL